MVPGVAGIFSGMRSRGGIGDPPRTTTIGAEQVLDLRRGLDVGRRRAADDAAQEPAGSVDADEAGEALARGAVGARDGDLGEQLGTERTLALLDAPALLADLTADLLARLLPQARGARRGEGLHLQRRAGVVQTHGDDALGLLLDLEPQVQALAGKDLDAAEIDVRTHRVRLGLVERADRRAIGQRGAAARIAASDDVGSVMRGFRPSGLFGRGEFPVRTR